MNKLLRIYAFLMLISALSTIAHEKPSENTIGAAVYNQEIDACDDSSLFEKIRDNTIYSLSQSKRMISHATIAAVFGLSAGKLDKYMKSHDVFPNAGLQLGLLVNFMLAINAANLAHRECCQIGIKGNPKIEYLAGFSSFLFPYLASISFIMPIERLTGLLQSIKADLL